MNNTQADGFEKSAPIKTYPPNDYGFMKFLATYGNGLMIGIAVSTINSVKKIQ